MFETDLPLRVLFLCTQNSARSQLGEALLNARRDPRVTAGSAGTHPADRVHPLAVALLESMGIEVSDARPKTVEQLGPTTWDLVITVCDSAKESCPFLPGALTAHWGVADPAAVAGDDVTRRAAFAEAARVLNARIDALLASPLGRPRLDDLLEAVRDIGAQIA